MSLFFYRGERKRDRDRDRDSTDMGEAQSRSVMLHHQDQPRNYGGQGGTSHTSSSSLRNGKCDKDGNFNFLPGKDEEDFTGSGGGGGDENRNQVRPRSLGPLGRDPPSSSPSAGYHNSSVTQRPRMPCWSPLEPLPEIENAVDGFGRVPPDGAEEGKMEEEEGGMMRRLSEMKRRERKQPQMKKGGMVVRGKEGDVDILKLEDDDEWGDSDSGSEDSYQSGSSMSSLHLEGTGDRLMGGWDRIGVGEPKLSPQDGDQCSNTSREWVARQQSFSRKSLSGSLLGDLAEEGRGGEDDDEQSSDTDGEKSELMDAMWTLRDRERFKAQEMEKHQVQLTMYRRLALIRWVRTLQSHVQEQQNRLQSSFDVILTHRKELLRMGAAAAVVANAAAPTAVGQ